MEEEPDEDMEMVVRPRDIVWCKMKMPFMFLPYRIFTEWTNIASLIRKRQRKDGMNPAAADIELETHIRNIHRDLHIVNWIQFGLDKLKFTHSSERRLA